MKVTAKAVVVVLMSMITSVVTAQTTSSNMSNPTPAPAILSSADSAQVRAILNSAPAANMGMTPLDSTLFVQLLDNGNDSLEVVFNEASELCGEKYEAGEKAVAYLVRSERGFNLHAIKPVKRPRQVSVADSTQLLQLDSARVNSQFVVRQREGKPQYGIDYQYEITDGTTKGNIAKMRQDKYGVSLLAGGDYSLGADITSFGGHIGVGYSVGNKTGRWSLAGEVDAIVRRTRFNHNAEVPGKAYNAYASELKIMPGIALGKHGEWRLRAGGLIGWEYYKTNSRETILDNGDRKTVKSGGDFVYPGAVTRLEYDSFGGPIGGYAEVDYQLHKSIIQNQDMIKEWVWRFSIGVYVKLFRHESHF